MGLDFTPGPEVVGVYLGLDLATKTGAAMLTPSGTRLYSATWFLELAGKTPGKRLRSLRTSLLSAMCGVVPTDRPHLLLVPRVVAYEKPVHTKGVHAAHVFGAWEGVLHEALEGFDVLIVQLTPSEVKRHATGHGMAQKHQMQAAAKKRWRLDDVGEDEADALWICDLARTRLTNGAQPA